MKRVVVIKVGGGILLDATSTSNLTAEIAELYDLDVLGKEPATLPSVSPPSSFDMQVKDGILAGYDTDYKEVMRLE